MTNTKTIDLRSDTVTRPTAAMRQAIANAAVGDDVFGDDPTVNRLQERVAELMGKQAAIFMPSGSMANQAAIRAQTQPGDEIICHSGSHIYHYEGGAPAAISGCSMRFLDGPTGQFNAEHVRQAVRPKSSHYAQTRLIVIENTHNRCGGSVWPIEAIAAIHEVAVSSGLSMHLDGARLMNACVASGHRPDEFARFFNTVSMCFSKGLGAPVGSIVAGSQALITRVHRFRKMFGGAMRQAGILAAAALYALDHHVDRLAEDHDNAKRLGAAIDRMPGVDLATATETNIVYFDVSPEVGTAASLCDRLQDAGVLMMPFNETRIRAVTHLDVPTDDIDRAITALEQAIKSTTPANQPQRA